MNRDDFRIKYGAQFGGPRPEWHGKDGDAIMAEWYRFSDKTDTEVLTAAMARLAGDDRRKDTRPTLGQLKAAYAGSDIGVRSRLKEGERCPDCENSGVIQTVWVRTPEGKLQVVDPSQQIRDDTAHIRAAFCHCTTRPAPAFLWRCRFPHGVSALRFVARARGETYMEYHPLDADIQHYVDRLIARVTARHQQRRCRELDSVAEWASKEEEAF